MEGRLGIGENHTIWSTLRCVLAQLASVLARRGVDPRGRAWARDLCATTGGDTIRIVEFDIVGRDSELAQINAFLAQHGPRVLLLEGEAGIGKTTLWREAIKRAREAGRLVLACTPSHAESEAGFVALGDLLRGRDSVVEALPAPQRRAIEGALMLREPEAPPEGHALGLGLVRILTNLASEGGVILAIDDVQWLDTASRGVLTFAARRLGESDVAFLLAGRTDEGDASMPLELDRTTLPDALQVRRIGSISLGALGRLIRQRLDLQLRRPELLRLEALSRGNPFFAIELAPTLVAGTTERLLPTNVSRAAHARLAQLDEPALDALLVTAVSPAPTLAAIEQVTGQRDVWTALEGARAAGIVNVAGDDVEFTHPLYATAVVERASPGRRREIHRRLADLARTPELRARHLAASTDEPAEGVAGEIEAGARDAFLRGAPEIGAELAARARDLTPGDGDASRARGLLEAECLYAAGDIERGRQRLAAVAEEAPAGLAQAEILFKLAQTPRNLEESVDLCERALRQAGGTSLAAQIAVVLATSLFVSGLGDRAISEAGRAIGLAIAAGDQLTEWRARSALAMMEGARGNGWDLETLQRAADLELATSERPNRDGAALWLVQALHFNDLVDQARTRATDLRARAIRAGDAIAATEIAAELATIEVRAGRFAAARKLALTALDEARQIGWEMGSGQIQQLLALIDAWLGRESDARTAGKEGNATISATGEQLGDIRHSSALVVLELGLERWETAARIADAALAAGGSVIQDPAVTSLHQHAAEAHAALGNIARAEELTLGLEELVVERPTPRLRLEALRCRGLVLAAQGELEGAIASLEGALGAADELGMPHQRGRTLLMLGRVQRRARRRADARATLKHAIELLDEAGVRLFAEQARRELARVGGRAPAGDRLTPTERRVAELVAAGSTNKDIAATLFVTVRTVEANLTRIYDKLGIHSRTELVILLSRRSEPDSQ